MKAYAIFAGQLSIEAFVNKSFELSKGLMSPVVSCSMLRRSNMFTPPGMLVVSALTIYASVHVHRYTSESGAFTTTWLHSGLDFYGMTQYKPFLGIVGSLNDHCEAPNKSLLIQ